VPQGHGEAAGRHAGDRVQSAPAGLPVGHRDLRAGRANALLAEDRDRIARDPRDLEDLIEIAEHHGAVVQSASAGEVNLTTGDGITMARVLCAFASRDTARAKTLIKVKGEAAVIRWPADELLRGVTATGLR
jgi:hypothetical protein